MQWGIKGSLKSGRQREHTWFRRIEEKSIQIINDDIFFLSASYLFYGNTSLGVPSVRLLRKTME
jgi:hypothetical protein